MNICIGLHRGKRSAMRLALACLVWTACSGLVLQAGESPSEYEVKAAYLYQFGKFVEWPSSKLPGSEGFSICTIGKDPFGARLDETLAGRTVQGWPVIAKRLQTTESAGDCDVLFISSSERSRMEEILEAVRGKSVLTVSESMNFLQQGGMINFQMDKRKVRFGVNLSALRQANLKVSSELLKVANSIK